MFFRGQVNLLTVSLKGEEIYYSATTPHLTVQLSIFLNLLNHMPHL